MSSPIPPVRRKKSVVLGGAVSTTILVVILTLMSRSSNFLILFALGWLIYGTVLLVRQFGKVAIAGIVVCVMSLVAGICYLYQTGLPKRLLVEKLRSLPAYAVHTHGPDWAPEAHFMILDDRIVDADIQRLTQFTGLDALEHIHFKGSPITDESIAHLAKLTHLSQLNFKNTMVTPEGIDQLQQLLPKCLIKVEWPESEETSASNPPQVEPVFRPPTQ